MSKSVSVIIPSFNYGRFIAEAIESVLAQTYAVGEIIVVDDGSTDETQQVVQVFGEAVKYIRQENAGVCSARNRGVEESTGELIAFLDADDIWEPSNLEKRVAKFETNEQIGLVHCGMREFDSETGETLKLYLEGKEGWVGDDLLLWEKPVVNVSGSAIVVEREAFDAVGGFDTRMKVGEDWDFCYRVARKYKVGFVPEPLINYRSHLRAAHRNVENMENGMAMFYEKAFATDDPDILKLRRRALGSFHRVMAGSYFHVREYGKASAHAARSVWMHPANLGYLIRFPFRRLMANRSLMGI